MTTPVASTFYSHRIFLSYVPDDFRRYFVDIVDKKGWDQLTEAERFQLDLGLFAWATILIYRSRMKPFDFNRELKRLVDADGKFFAQDSTLPLTRGIQRQELTMQLGIEAILRRDDVKERIDRVNVFQQYMYDTLYWPSYRHEKGVKGRDEDGNPIRFSLTLDSLKEYLWFRAKGERKLRDEDFPRADMAAVLFEALYEYLELLAKPEKIRSETIRFARQLRNEKDQRLWVAAARAIETRGLLAIDKVVGHGRNDKSDR